MELIKMEYKKSYKGLWIWIVVFCAAYFLCIFLPPMRTQLLTAILDNVMSIAIFALTLIIYLTENVYWYTGIEYKVALNAGSERRKAYALIYVKRFGIYAAAFLVYTLISILVGIPYGIDILVATLGLIVTAVSTVNLKL